MDAWNYYKILGIEKTASQQEIKRAYREKVKKYHPDAAKTTEDEELFKNCVEAYRILSNEKLKKDYDRSGIKKEKNMIHSDFQEVYKNFRSPFGTSSKRS